MKLKIFSIYDSKAKAYLPPFLLPMTEQGIRVFKNAASDKKHAFGANPGDYTLFEIGEFDDNTANIESYKTHENLGLAQHHQEPDPQLDLPIQEEEK